MHRHDLTGRVGRIVAGEINHGCRDFFRFAHTLDRRMPQEEVLEFFRHVVHHGIGCGLARADDVDADVAAGGLHGDIF